MDEPRFFNRDLSWLDFNDRVLAQAEHESVPLLERVKFCAICASNLDEFFMKRVGLLKRRLADPERADRRGPAGFTPGELAPRIREQVIAHQTRLSECFSGSIVPALARAGIHVAPIDHLTQEQLAEADRHFDEVIFPVLTPLAVDPTHRFPFISNLSENIGVLIQPAGGGGPVFGRVKIPTVIGRFVRLPGAPRVRAAETEPRAESDAADEVPTGEITLVALDALMARHIGRLFPGSELAAVGRFRVTRSAVDDPEDDDEPEDLLRAVEDELRRRRFASAVRVETPPDAPADILDYVTAHLGLTQDDVYPRGGPLEYRDLLEIASLPRPDLKDEPWTPVPPASLADVSDSDSMFARIRAGDVVVHHPYESFAESTSRFIELAARDPAVIAIKQTIYRTTPDSAFVEAMIRAADAGKNVACLVELRARFDEEHNVSFARRLEEAGVHVAYGVVGLKTHCKLSLVVRSEPGPAGPDVVARPAIRSYAHIGTGNYHPKTAQLYTDLGLLTADPSITREVVKVFNSLTGHAADEDFESLLVAPRTMRPRFEKLVKAEIKAAKKGKPAAIVAKMNSLEDRALTRLLYEASDAGVPVTLFVRGFCCLRPGVPGLSENIRVVSTIGRFLEHSRIFYFANGADVGQEFGGRAETDDGAPAGSFFIGSADWMYRNLNDRVEVITPVNDHRARAQLWNIFRVLDRDRRNSWLLRPDGSYRRRKAEPGVDARSTGTFVTFMNSYGRRA